MIVYLVYGYCEGFFGEEQHYLYGIYSTKELAEKCKKYLEENPISFVDETFEIVAHILDEPIDN